MYYKFDDKLKEGIVGEEIITRYLVNDGFTVKKANPEQEKQGIDLTCFKLEKSHTVEVKSDLMAHETGNSVIELVSVFKNGSVVKEGWAKTCQSEYVFYLIIKDLYFYVLKMSVIRKILPTWMCKYRSVFIANKDYQTIVILVPLRELEKHSEKVINLPIEEKIR